ncbi:OmpL47-type beta-barrel domain-containing protein [Paenibacillus sp. R14(2021)]|uniref:OmpL47-type beta-barrel domain-containing protein n=1 Tax=Paenibacillus sp. R14(2021) TaxID=2859228 RepID=UPI0021581F76|nr:hypothetical protein [Paenibacillus sp. R14(2021)]
MKMKNKCTSKVSSLVILLLVLQLLLLPVQSVLGAAGSSILPPSNLATQLITPDDAKLTWSSVVNATGYNVYEITDGQLILRGTTATNSYTVNNLAEGSYTYVVSTLSAEGESGPCAPITVSISYPEMAAPTLSYSLVNVNDIKLSWTAVPYAESYSLYQMDSDGQQKLLTSGTARTFTISNAPEGTYKFAVSAANTLYGVSPLSAQVQAEIIHPTMAAPGNSTYTLANGNDLTLKWDAAANATDYKVYQLVDGQKVLKSTVTGTSVAYSNVPAGEYVYEIHSESSRFGESAEGSQVTVNINTVTMTAPTNFRFTIANANDITLKWDAVTFATSYKVYQIMGGQKVLKSTVTGTSAVYTNVPAGDYTYEVHSVSADFGESAEGSQLALTVNAVSMEAPANLSYTTANINDITLKWDAAANATSYKVYQIVNGLKVLKSTVSGTAAAYTGLPEGDYSYEIHSFSSKFGESAQGAAISFSIQFPTMEPPSNVVQTITSVKDFKLSWNAAANATSYKVYQIVDGQKVLKSTVTGLSVTYTNMPAGEYQYEVHAFSSRFGESAEGSTVVVTLNGIVLEAPANLAFSILNGNDIKLTWSAVANATSYKVYRVVNGEYVLKSTLSSTTITYTNQAADNYDFVVVAVSTLYGESPKSSEVNIALIYPVMAAPGNLTSKIQNGNDVLLSWTAVQYANSYKVYELVGTGEVLKATTASLNTVISNVSAGDHTYMVRSVSTRFGESLAGSQVTVAMTEIVLQKPANPSYTFANGNDIVLRWDTVPFATNYKVYQIVDGQKTLKSTVTSTTVTYANIAEGSYEYEIHSYNSRYGESEDGSDVTVSVVFPDMQAPVNLTKTAANVNDITLKWNAATYATSYKVYQIVNGEKVLKSTITGTSVGYAGLAEGMYEYEVHSVSSRFGESAEGSRITFSIVWPIVQPPVLKATVFNGNNITFSWQAATWATEYRVYEVVDGNRQQLYKGTGLSAQVNNLSETVHHFEIEAYSARFGLSAPSERLDVNVIYPEMQPPAASIKLLSPTSALISWNFITYANGYNVYEMVNGLPVQLARNVNNLSYTLTNLSYKNHEFYVTSYSNSFGESAPSNIVLAKLIVDKEAPVTTANTTGSWTKQSPVTVTLTATDNETGVANTFYSLNDAPFEIGTSVTVTEEGIHKLTYYSVDKVGNTEAEKTSYVKIDRTKPVTSATVPTGWSNEAATVTLTAADAMSGVEKTYYSIDGSAYEEGTSVEVSTDGVHQINFYSVDHAGNVEQAHSVTVNVIDRTAPATTAEAPAGWVKEAAVTLTATDAQSGVANTYYSIDGSDYVEGTKIEVSTDGVHEISFYSVDRAGNVEKAQRSTVMIDRTAPTTAAAVPSGWSKQDVTVTLTANDAQSGVAKTYYSLDGSPYAAGSVFTVESEGIHNVSYYSADAAGNEETVRQLEVKIDKSAPIVTMDLNPSYKLGDSVKLTYLAADSLSGIASEKMTVTGPNGTVEAVKDTSLKIDQPGVYTVTVTVMNAAGLSTTIKKQFSVYIAATIEVTPKVIKGNSGVFTVRVTLPQGFSTEGFDLNTATINGVKALNSNNGYYSQAKMGQFKFERSEFTWNQSEVLLEFRGYVNGILVVGQTMVKVNP